MPKYRKRSIAVEAEQWTPAKSVEGVHTKPDADMPADVRECVTEGINAEYPNVGVVKTRDGWYLVKPTDWIITDSKGNKTKCSNGVFTESYDKFAENELWCDSLGCGERAELWVGPDPDSPPGSEGTNACEQHRDSLRGRGPVVPLND